MTDRFGSRLLDVSKPAHITLVLLAFFIASFLQAYLPLAHLQEVGNVEGNPNQGRTAIAEDNDPSHHHSENCPTCEQLRTVQPTDLPLPVFPVVQVRLVELTLPSFDSAVPHEPAIHGAESRGPPASL